MGVTISPGTGSRGKEEASCLKRFNVVLAKISGVKLKSWGRIKDLKGITSVYA